jgi:Asp-tRNA(Asn)/Glu-tRNA(Gln) amidotransferase A subunit family amidase
VNCLTEIFFDQALERAKAVDDYFAKNGKPMGPFHGLPISLKDSFNVKGVQATIGYVSFAKHPPAGHNSALVEILLRHGAVVYVKTNLPQTMMTADSENNLFGRTLNPIKLSLTAGGSTGGEGALLKIRGSVLGIGTDIAGSVRIPALCNGIFGFKPSASRVPFAGKTPPGRLGAPSAILPSIGPEGHSIRDMELFMKTVIDSQPWELDENSLNIPWRGVDAYSRPLRLGLITEDPKRALHPSMLRTMKSAAKELTSSGHVIIPLDGLVPDIWESAVLSWKYFLLDPKKTVVSHINATQEPWVASIPTATFPELKDYNPSLDEVFDMNVARAKILHVYHNLIVQHQLDGFIMPAYQATAVPHDTYGVPIYTVLPNLLNFPAGSIPYLKAEKSLDKEYVRVDVKYEPLCK